MRTGLWPLASRRPPSPLRLTTADRPPTHSHFGQSITPIPARLEPYPERIVLALRRTCIGLALGMLAASLIVAATRADIARGVVEMENGVQQRIGVEIAVAGIYLEESGLPMPVP